MWVKWVPWRYLMRDLARRHGFLDPLSILMRLEGFAQPSEVGAPIELLRAGAVFHARGLLNTRAIQHNLDWVWPYWVERQFDPRGEAFIPRAFSLTHVNLTHRDWTAVGVPDCPALPIVDPRGLVTPHWDGWSLDAWILADDGRELVASRAPRARQRLTLGEDLGVETETEAGGLSLQARASVSSGDGRPELRLSWRARVDAAGWLAVVLRPYNPEGVSVIHEVTYSDSAWTVDRTERVEFPRPPDRLGFSEYRDGDVYARLPEPDTALSVRCGVGLATAAALFRLEPGREREISAHVPLDERDEAPPRGGRGPSWEAALASACALQVPDERMRFLFDAALRTLVLHSPGDGDVYPGPFTYKRFWFRDAAFIIDGLLAAGLVDRAERALDRFPSLQRHDGYFRSQEGEWDSNGEALWIMERFCRLTGRAAKPEWLAAARKGARWIIRKRLPPGAEHAGLLPAGFSAEHLGLNDFYYWDDFWAAAGLRSAAELLDAGEPSLAAELRRAAGEFLDAIDASLESVYRRRDARALASPRRAPTSAYPRAIPAAPGRRMDSGAIGSIAAGYPLRLWGPKDGRLLDTTAYLLDRCFVSGGFFQDMIHSGINAYLTLHVAQILLRAGDARCAELIRAVAGLASATGQWPEAIHPATRGGCMGDGQHAWAAAEWVMMIRNCFVREEPDGLVLCSGIPDEWLAGDGVRLGPTPTPYGAITVSMRRAESDVLVEWTWASPRGRPARFEVRRLGRAAVAVAAAAGVLRLPP